MAVDEESPKRREVEVDGVWYDVWSRARYIDGFLYCSSCCVWLRRKDRKKMLRCPFCHRILKRGGLSSKGGKRYISVEDSMVVE